MKTIELSLPRHFGHATCPLPLHWPNDPYPPQWPGIKNVGDFGVQEPEKGMPNHLGYNMMCVYISKMYIFIIYMNSNDVVVYN